MTKILIIFIFLGKKAKCEENIAYFSNLHPNKKNAFRTKRFNLRKIILIYVFLDKKA